MSKLIVSFQRYLLFTGETHLLQDHFSWWCILLLQLQLPMKLFIVFFKSFSLSRLLFFSSLIALFTIVSSEDLHNITMRKKKKREGKQREKSVKCKTGLFFTRHVFLLCFRLFYLKSYGEKEKKIIFSVCLSLSVKVSPKEFQSIPRFVREEE